MSHSWLTPWVLCSLLYNFIQFVSHASRAICRTHWTSPGGSVRSYRGANTQIAVAKDKPSCLRKEATARPDHTGLRGAVASNHWSTTKRNQGPETVWKCNKKQIFEIFVGVTQDFGGCRCVELVEMITRHTPRRFVLPLQNLFLENNELRKPDSELSN